jgi:hypothetical protein
MKRAGLLRNAGVSGGPVTLSDAAETTDASAEVLETRRVQTLGHDMSCGQYSWLITIKNGASHPMVPLGIYNNHYFWILIFWMG